MNHPVVVKVGGSLLDWPGLPERLGSYLAELRSEADPVLIVGGGRAADLVRDLDRIHGLGEARSHELALRALDLTAHLLAALLPDRVIVADDPASFPAVWSIGLIPIFAPRRFLTIIDDSSGDPLPHSWTVTSDSIAARVAVRLDACELVLLKSRPVPPGISRAEAAQLGLVDPVFPAVARPLGSVLYLNLRDPGEGPFPILDDGGAGA